MSHYCRTAITSFESARWKFFRDSTYTMSRKKESNVFRLRSPKNVWFLLSRDDVHPVHEKLSSRRFEQTNDCQTHFGVQIPKTFDFYFLDMMYITFIKDFHHADSNEVIAVRLISASWAQKRLILTFLIWCTSSSWKIFTSPIIISRN